MFEGKNDLMAIIGLLVLLPAVAGMVFRLFKEPSEPLDSPPRRRSSKKS